MCQHVNSIHDEIYEFYQREERRKLVEAAVQETVDEVNLENGRIDDNE